MRIMHNVCKIVLYSMYKLYEPDRRNNKAG